MKKRLYGAILGDLAGQPYEFDQSYKKPFNIHNPDSVITDDSVLTLASAKSILSKDSIWKIYKDLGNKYAFNYCGKMFKEWLTSPVPVMGNSYGNGSIMRISPFMYTNSPLANIMASMMTSHHHEECYQSAIRLYNLYKGNYPPAIAKPKKFTAFTARAIDSIEFCESAFLYTKSTHEAIKLAVKCKGDTDTHASILGELSNYTYNDITKEDVDYVESKLPKELLTILRKFNKL